MMTLVELSKQQIREEIRAVRAAAHDRPKTRAAALAFLKSIGADGWSNSPTKFTGDRPHRRKK